MVRAAMTLEDRVWSMRPRVVYAQLARPHTRHVWSQDTPMRTLNTGGSRTWPETSSPGLTGHLQVRDWAQVSTRTFSRAHTPEDNLGEVAMWTENLQGDSRGPWIHQPCSASPSGPLTWTHITLLL